MNAVATVRLGTRQSGLAIAQATIASEALAAVLGPIQLVRITTGGDRISARQPRGRWIAGDGQFTRELERALLDRQVDLVVHSYKDLPTAEVDGLLIGAVLPRADARDCLVTRGGGLHDLPFAARIGTSSPRRTAQLAATRSDLIAMPVRGNVETRLRRLRAGEFDALILAAAGLDRLGISVPVEARLPFELMLPAPAQGALAIQVRANDGPLAEFVRGIDHPPTRIAVNAERALLRRIGGGCLAPLGAFGEMTGNRLRLRAAYEDASGALLRAESTGPADQPGEIVESVANQILTRGTTS